MTRLIALLGSILAIAPVAHADEVKLRSGGSLVGIARIAGNRITVEVPAGFIGIDADEVTCIIYGVTPLHDLLYRLEVLGPNPAAPALFELACWARQNGLTHRHRELLMRVIDLDPAHRGAHEELGYVRHGDRWFTQAEHLRALGQVEFRGRWISQGERAALLAKEVQIRQKAKTVKRIRSRVIEPQGRFGMPSYPTTRRSGGSSGGGYMIGFYGCYGYIGGIRGNGWVYNWTGPYTGFVVKRDSRPAGR